MINRKQLSLFNILFGNIAIYLGFYILGSETTNPVLSKTTVFIVIILMCVVSYIQGMEFKKYENIIKIRGIE